MVEVEEGAVAVAAEEEEEEEEQVSVACSRPEHKKAGRSFEGKLEA